MMPEGWTSSDLGSIVDINRGLTWKRDQEVNAPADGVVPVLRIPNIQETLVTDDIRYLRGIKDEQRRRYAATKNWILMVGSNGNPARVGNCILVEEESQYLFASFLLGINSRDGRQVDPRFLFYVLRSSPIQSAISDSVQGSTGLRNISLRMLRSQSILLPPLPEQKKIAAILGSVDAAIQATQAVIDQTRKVKQGLLAQLLTRGIGHTRFKKTEIGEIPEGWEVVRLGDMGEFTNGINKGKEDFGFGVPFVNLQDVFGVNQITASPEGLVNATPDEIDRYDLREGDVLFVRSSVKPEGVGLTAVISERLRDVVFSGFLIRFRQHELRLTKDFMKYCFYEPGFRRSLLIKSSVSANTNVNQKSLGQLMVAVPPAKEQEAMCSMFDSLESAIKLNETTLRQMAYAKHGLMQDLLTGRVRVKGVA